MIKKLVLLFVLSVVLSLNLIIPVLAEDYHDTVIETDIKEIQAQDIISGNVTVTFNNMNLYNENVKFSYHIQDENGNDIHLKKDDTLDEESYKIDIAENIVISAADDLGFVYALLKISEKYLDIKPFWFWLDQKIEKKDSVRIEKCKLIHRNQR